MTRMQTDAAIDTGDWRQRLARIVDTVREMSVQSDPQAMVRAYGGRMDQIMPTDRMVSLSRRGLAAPQYRITRSSLWPDEVNPWAQPDRLPVYDHGVLGELLYSDDPHIINRLALPPDDPAAEYFHGMGSLIAIPLFDQGVAMNMVVLMREQPGAFAEEEFPNLVLTSNLFGRATHNLVLASQLHDAYQMVDRELQVVATMQRLLLPAELPAIPTMELAVHYQTSRRAGGDYYDFFELPDGKWGVLIADVSGHGTPAAVLMAITRSIAHAFPGPPLSPSKMLQHINHRLATDYTARSSAFVTAFYGVYDAQQRELVYASAGHHPPRVKRCRDGSIFSLDGPRGLPLGIEETEHFEEARATLQVGDQLVLYTDGITEAFSPDGRMFGLSNLDRVLENCCLQAQGLVKAAVDAVDEFTGGAPADDDRTVIVAKIR